MHTWKLIGTTDGTREQIHLRILKVFAEMLEFCGTLEKIDKHVEAVFDLLQVRFFAMKLSTLPVKLTGFSIAGIHAITTHYR